MQIYKFLDENKKEVWRITADLEDIFDIEKHFNKSVDEINVELKEKGYFVSNNKKYFVVVEFLDFIRKTEEF